MASPAVSNLGEIEWTYTLSFRVTCCRNGDELLIVRSVAPHSPSPVRTLTSQRPQICCACRTCTWTDQGCSDGMPRISTRCSSRAGQAEKRCYDRRGLGPASTRSTHRRNFTARRSLVQFGVDSDGSHRNFSWRRGRSRPIMLPIPNAIVPKPSKWSLYISISSEGFQ